MAENKDGSFGLNSDAGLFDEMRLQRALKDEGAGHSNLPTGEYTQVSGHDHDKDSTLDRDPTNDKARTSERDKSAAERVGEVIKEARAGEYGVAHAIGQLQDKIDKARDQERGRGQERGGRAR